MPSSIFSACRASFQISQQMEELHHGRNTGISSMYLLHRYYNNIEHQLSVVHHVISGYIITQPVVFKPPAVIFPSYKLGRTAKSKRTHVVDHANKVFRHHKYMRFLWEQIELLHQYLLNKHHHWGITFCLFCNYASTYCLRFLPCRDARSQ
jgi:hypothetical protein